MTIIHSQHSWIVVPLSIDAPSSIQNIQSAVITSSKNVQLPVFEEVGLQPTELRKGLSHLLDKENTTEKIGSIFKLIRREALGLPRKSNDSILFYARTIEKPFEICIKDVRLGIFESGIGMVMFRADMKNEHQLEDVMNLLYYLCEPKDERNHFEITHKIWNEAEKKAYFETTALSLKQFLFTCAQYFTLSSDDTQQWLIRKPLIYSYLVADSLPEPDLLENLARNYNSAYKLYFDELKENPHILQIFSNSYWCASSNGLTNISVLGNTQKTNTFFENSFEQKWENDYFFLFLNTLHQKQALIQNLNSIRQYHRPFHDYDLMNQRLIQFQKAKEEFSLFRLRCFFQCPSAIDHINALYDLVQNAFSIQIYQNEFTSKFESLIDYYNTTTTRKKEVDDHLSKIKKIRIEIYVALLGTLVTVLTIYSSSMSIIERWTGEATEVFSLSSIVFILTLSIPVITILANTKSQLDEIKELKEEIETLKKLL